MTNPDEKDKYIKELTKELDDLKFIQSQNKQYIFTLEAELHNKNNKIKRLEKDNKKFKFKPVNTEPKSKKGKILEKFLNKSNSYHYYKSNYENLLGFNNNIIKENKQLNNEIEKLKNDKDKLKKNSESLKKDISSYENLIMHYADKENNLENKINSLTQNVNILEKRMEYGLDNIVGLKNINIAYVLTSFPQLSETFVVNEIKWLIQNNYNVIIFKRREPEEPADLDFHVKTVRFNDKSELEKLLVENKIDLIHSHFIYPIGTNITFPLAERLKIPFTLFAHGYDIFIHKNDKLNNISEISKSKYCKGIFTLSEFHKQYLLKRGVSSDKIIITKQATSYELKPIKEKPNNIKKIISISRFVEKKGIDVLIDAAKILENENYIFEIYGFGDLKSNLEEKITELNCENISIKGKLQPNEVELKLRESDLLICPSKVAKNGDMDGFPTVIFEAMANGLPFITTNVSAIPEIIEDCVNGFMIEPNNPELLAEKIKKVSSMPSDELFRIINKAQEDVKNITGVDKTMNTYIDFLTSQFLK